MDRHSAFIPISNMSSLRHLACINFRITFIHVDIISLLYFMAKPSCLLFVLLEIWIQFRELEALDSPSTYPPALMGFVGCGCDMVLISAIMNPIQVLSSPECQH